MGYYENEAAKQKLIEWFNSIGVVSEQRMCDYTYDFLTDLGRDASRYSKTVHLQGLHANALDCYMLFEAFKNYVISKRI